MPAKFRLELQQGFKDQISGQTAAVRSKRQSGEWCTYAQFVEKLAKGMNTSGEEAHHYSTGMAGEAGEVLDITKKTWIYEKPLDIEHIIEEMGDLRWYYQGMLNLLGLTDEDIQAANTVKLLKRYPDGVYSNQAAIDRADKAIPHGAGAGAIPSSAPRRFFGQPLAAEPPLPQMMAQRKEQLDRERLLAMGNRERASATEIAKNEAGLLNLEDPGK
jgi:NTP pyrophosphatase (non-canonical NTP hydrolase)